MHIMSPNFCLNSFYRLGDPVMDWRGWPSRSSWFQLCPQGADSPRAGGGQSATCEFFPCSSCSCSPSLSICRGFEFSLGKVSDSPQQWADGLRVPGGRSVIRGRLWRFCLLYRTVHGPGPDSPWCVCGQSAVAGRTVRVAHADGPPSLAGRSARACVLCFLVRFLPSFLVLPRVLQGIVPKTRGWSITSLSWRLVCDSIHRLCVTGIWLGYRPGSLRRIFTGSYSLPPL
jgi:hypothetical protein